MTHSVTPAAEGHSRGIPGPVAWGNRLHSLVEKGSDDSAALNVSFVHQRVEVRQQGVPGLEDFSRVRLKG